MAPKYLAILMFLYISAGIMGAAMEDTMIGAVGSDSKTTVDDLLVYQKIDFTDVTGGFGIVGAVGGFFTAVYTIMTFDFAFLEATGDHAIYTQVAKWILVGPFIFAIVWGLIATLVGVFSRVFTP
jgi:hypothetical protein